MKLQIAFDRFTLKETIDLLISCDENYDIVEVGTSLIKEYGNEAIVQVRKCTNKLVLADLKTMDQGAYEFESAYRSGADIATVMGVAPIKTIEACYRVAKKNNKTVMIDLLEVSEKRLEQLLQFEDAIFCMHRASDDLNKDFSNIDEMNIRRLAYAGGITYEIACELSKDKSIELIVVGSSITHQMNIRDVASRFYKLTKI